MAIQSTPQQKNARQKERKLLLSSLFVDAPVRVEPEEPQKIVVAGMTEARVQKEYPDTFFGRARAVWRGEMSTMFKASLYFIAFTLPFILVIAVAAGFFESHVMDGTYHFMGDIGIGYPGGGDSISVAVASLYWDVYMPVLFMLAGAAVIASLGMAGHFYTAKRSYFQDYYKRITRTYWLGFAKYWWKFLVTSLFGILIASAMGTSVLYLLQQQTLGIASAGAYCATVFSFLIGAPLLLVPMVMLSLFASYELSYLDAFKNALVIICNCPMMVILTGLLSAVPLLLMILGNIAAIIIYLLMAVAGFNFIALNWTAMANRGMTKCSLIKSQMEKQSAAAQKQQKQKVVYAKAGDAQVVQKKKPQNKQPYQNPKKKKKK